VRSASKLCGCGLSYAPVWDEEDGGCGSLSEGCACMEEDEGVEFVGEHGDDDEVDVGVDVV
jgi:hypothetical protein